VSFAYPLPKGTRQVVPDYACDGVTAPALPIPFRFFDPTDIWIGWAPAGYAGLWPGMTQKVFGVDYTVTGAGLEAGGTATFTSVPPAGILRVMGLRTPSRLTSVVNDGALISSAIENELDVQEMTLQELRRDVNAMIAVLNTLLALSSLASFQATYLAWFLGLPTTLPATSGQPWNDGGVLAIS
jgi:hypothetical protein